MDSAGPAFPGALRQPGPAGHCQSSPKERGFSQFVSLVAFCMGLLENGRLFVYFISLVLIFVWDRGVSGGGVDLNKSTFHSYRLILLSHPTVWRGGANVSINA